MPYDLFISYSRRDNERGQVTALKAQIESSFRAFAGRDLRVFFDTHEIAGMDDWRQKIQRSLRDSQVFLAVLSPHYLASPYCRWEWEGYVRYEAMRQCLGEGVAPVFFVTLPDAADPKTDQAFARWIGDIQRRQTFTAPLASAGQHAQGYYAGAIRVTSDLRCLPGFRGIECRHGPRTSVSSPLLGVHQL